MNGAQKFDQLKNVELKESVHLLLNQVVQEEQKLQRRRLKRWLKRERDNCLLNQKNKEDISGKKNRRQLESGQKSTEVKP